MTQTAPKIHHIPASADPTGILPPTMYPLPIPCKPVLRPSAELTKVLDWATKALETLPEEIPNAISRILDRDRKGTMAVAYWAELATSVQFYINFMHEEDDPDCYPKGIGVVQESHRRSLVAAIGWGRTLDMAGFVMGDYRDALNRCRWSCVARHLGHAPDDGDDHTFSEADVLVGMRDSLGWSGLVSYDHIKAQLLREAVDKNGND